MPLRVSQSLPKANGIDSITQAAQKLNLNYATVRRYIKRKIKPQNGWQWFLEKDNNWIKHIDNGKIK